MTIEEWVAYAKELGFSEAAPVVPADLKPNAEVRAMCAADKCHAYGKNWTCPPECGSLEECAARISAKTRGILVQSVAQLEDSFDIEGMMEAEQVPHPGRQGPCRGKGRPMPGHRRLPHLRQVRLSGEVPLPGAGLLFYGGLRPAGERCLRRCRRPLLPRPQHPCLYGLHPV